MADNYDYDELLACLDDKTPVEPQHGLAVPQNNQFTNDTKPRRKNL